MATAKKAATTQAQEPKTKPRSDKAKSDRFGTTKVKVSKGTMTL